MCGGEVWDRIFGDRFRDQRDADARIVHIASTRGSDRDGDGRASSPRPLCVDPAILQQSRERERKAYGYMLLMYAVGTGWTCRDAENTNI